ncbi:MAG: L-idonate 5-dehydrogenase [Betaproteobacteria bacterium]|jgi:L-idonate 5-dehydrogenase|nr:L-idonate 5-dehydrogenase [Betaproteobacteria bacterium]
MKAIVCHAPEDLRLDNFDTDALGAHQLQVDVAYGGICGSDLHYYQHGGFGTVRIKEPMVLGHEVSGIVRVVGSAVQSFKAGQRIAISPSRPCGQCQYCQKGQHNHCLDMRFFGSAMRFPHVQGAFRQILVIDASQAHPLNDSLSLSLAALAEPLSVGLHAIQRAGSVFGKQVLVTGCGPIGTLLIGALRRAGAARIVAVDIADKPLECARAMGADETINIAKHSEALAPFAVNKGVFDVMFEASGNDRALRSGLDVVAPRGVIVSIGLGGDSTLPLNQLVGKELELRGTFRFHEEFAVAVRFLNEGLIDGRPVISHVMDLDDAIHAFELASDKSQAMKVQINFGAEALV